MQVMGSREQYTELYCRNYCLHWVGCPDTLRIEPRKLASVRGLADPSLVLRSKRGFLELSSQ